MLFGSIGGCWVLLGSVWFYWVLFESIRFNRVLCVVLFGSIGKSLTYGLLNWRFEGSPETTIDPQTALRPRSPTDLRKAQTHRLRRSSNLNEDLEYNGGMLSAAVPTRSSVARPAPLEKSNQFPK